MPVRISKLDTGKDPDDDDADDHDVQWDFCMH